MSATAEDNEVIHSTVAYSTTCFSHDPLVMISERITVGGISDWDGVVKSSKLSP